MFALKQIKGVKEVYFFDSDWELTELVAIISPDIMVVGSDWKGKEVIGSQHAKEVQFFDRIQGFSTTGILEVPYEKG